MTAPVPKPVVPTAPAPAQDPVWDAAVNAPVEPEDADERHAVDAAKRAHAAPVAGARVTEQIAERLRNAR
jgi:hypothetical protein